jgi:hypothetical protein
MSAVTNTGPLRIDFSEAPKDPLERLLWLSGARAAFDAAVNAEWSKAYFDARAGSTRRWTSGCTVASARSPSPGPRTSAEVVPCVGVMD